VEEFVLLRPTAEYAEQIMMAELEGRVKLPRL
jgi:hypothetical protein